MKINDILAIDPEDILKMSEVELRTVVRDLGRVANTRITKLEKAGLTHISQAYQTAFPKQKRGKNIGRKSRNKTGRFSAKGINLNQLRAEYKRAKGFVTAPTSTIKGAQQYGQELKNLTGIDPAHKRSIAKFWRQYHKWVEQDAKRYQPSDQPGDNRDLVAMFREVYKYRNSEAENIAAANELYNRAYEQMQQERYAAEQEIISAFNSDDITEIEDFFN